MKILYISQTKLDLKQINIYSDLINELLSQGHSVTSVFADSGCEKNSVEIDGEYKSIRIRVANQFGVNIIKKALVLLTLESKFKKAIKKHLKNEEFDLVLYATPPITLAGVVKCCKEKYKAKTYLMLKDIFPQNAIDLAMLKKRGIRGLIYKYFRKKEKKLYEYSDKIGCMSQGNVDYLLNENEYINKDKVEIFPNATIIRELSEKDCKVLDELNIDKSKLLFIYGGNFGKPQGIDKYVEALRLCEKFEDALFINIGKGSEKTKFDEQVKDLKNVVTMDYLPSTQYDRLCRACDIGLVLLDNKFTIPNFPSRTLSYLNNAMPILAFTDKNTDYKDFIIDNGIGKWAQSDNVDKFVECVEWFLNNKEKLAEMGNAGRKIMEEQFNVEECVKKLERFQKGEN